MRKTLKFFLILVITLAFATSTFAASTVSSGDATMKLVENNVCDITFGKYGSFEKKLVKCDTDNKTIDISLTAKNNQEKQADKAGEVVLLIDGSNSMKSESVTVNGTTTTREKLVLTAAQELVNKLYAANSTIKIGVVEFATSTDTTKEGTSADAKTITSTLSNDKSTVTTALNTVASDKMGARTDIEEGLKAADALLATSTNSNTSKYVVVLTDAIPNTATGVTFDTYSDKSAVPTKNELLALKNKNINVVSMLINMTDDEIQASQESPKPTYKQVAQKIFGTTSNPTAGPVYYVTDKDVTTTVTDSIYADLIPTNEYALTDIVIKDYFPKNIIDNFDFAYLTQPAIGKVTAKVDTSDNSITWTISELKPQETATFTYRLKIKSSISSDIIGVNLPTNKNVTIDYKENGKSGDQKHNDKCPKVALDVEATKDIPQTGNNTGLMVSSLVACSLVIGAASFIYLRKNRI